MKKLLGLTLLLLGNVAAADVLFSTARTWTNDTGSTMDFGSSATRCAIGAVFEDNGATPLPTLDYNGTAQSAGTTYSHSVLGSITPYLTTSGLPSGTSTMNLSSTADFRAVVALFGQTNGCTLTDSAQSQGTSNTTSTPAVSVAAGGMLYACAMMSKAGNSATWTGGATEVIDAEAQGVSATISCAYKAFPSADAAAQVTVTFTDSGRLTVYAWSVAPQSGAGNNALIVSPASVGWENSFAVSVSPPLTGEITTATLSTGDTLTATTATSSSATFQVSKSLFRASASLDNTNVDTAYTVTVTDGTDTTLTDGITFASSLNSNESLFTITGTPVTGVLGATAEAGDKAFVVITSGGATIGTDGALTNKTGTLVLTSYIWDVSAGAWIAGATYSEATGQTRFERCPGVAGQFLSGQCPPNHKTSSPTSVLTTSITFNLTVPSAYLGVGADVYWSVFAGGDATCSDVHRKSAYTNGTRSWRGIFDQTDDSDFQGSSTDVTSSPVSVTVSGLTADTCYMGFATVGTGLEPRLKVIEAGPLKTGAADDEQSTVTDVDVSWNPGHWIDMVHHTTAYETDTTLSGAEVADQTELSVTDTTNFTSGKTVVVRLDDGTWHATTSTGKTGTTVTIADAIPSPGASSGNPIRALKGILQGVQHYDRINTYLEGPWCTGDGPTAHHGLKDIFHWGDIEEGEGEYQWAVTDDVLHAADMCGDQTINGSGRVLFVIAWEAESGHGFGQVGTLKEANGNQACAPAWLINHDEGPYIIKGKEKDGEPSGICIPVWWRDRVPEAFANFLRALFQRYNSNVRVEGFSLEGEGSKGGHYEVASQLSLGANQFKGKSKTEFSIKLFETTDYPYAQLISQYGKSKLKLWGVNSYTPSVWEDGVGVQYGNKELFKFLTGGGMLWPDTFSRKFQPFGRMNDAVMWIQCDPTDVGVGKFRSKCPAEELEGKIVIFSGQQASTNEDGWRCGRYIARTPGFERASHGRCEFEWFAYDTAAEVVTAVLDTCCKAGEPQVSSSYDGNDFGVRATHNSWRQQSAAIRRNGLMEEWDPNMTASDPLFVAGPVSNGRNYSPNKLTTTSDDYITGIMGYANSAGNDKTAVHDLTCPTNVTGYKWVEFTSGGGAGKGIVNDEDLVGATIQDASVGGSTSATVEFVMRWYDGGGSWAGGTAAGFMRLSSVTGSFDGGSIDRTDGAAPTDIMTLGTAPVQPQCQTGLTP